MASDTKGHRIEATQLLALALCAFALLIDGFDVFLVGNLGPAIAAHFAVPAAKLGQIFLFQQIGLATGAFLISPISDRIGRKTVMLGCAAMFGALTLVAPLAMSLLQFALLRGVAAIFLSGLIPNAIALLTESTPRHRHGLFVSIAFTGYGVGSVGGALVGALLLQDFGWQSGFIIGGIAPLLYVLIGARLIRVSGPSDQTSVAAVGGSDIPAMGLAGVFSPGWRVATSLIWSIFFLTSGTLAMMFAWMPTFFVERGGIAMGAYSAVASLSLIGALLGTLSIGFVLDRFRPIYVLIGTFLFTAGAMMLLGNAVFGTPIFPLALVALSLFQGAGQTGLSAFTAQFYPNTMRTIGVGWAFGAGRVGGIVGPIVGATMLAGKFTVEQFFLALAAPMVVSALLLSGLARMQGRGHRQETRRGPPPMASVARENG